MVEMLYTPMYCILAIDCNGKDIDIDVDVDEKCVLKNVISFYEI